MVIGDRRGETTDFPDPESWCQTADTRECSMGSDRDFLMFEAIDDAGHASSAIPSAVLTRRCAQGLIGVQREASGAVLEPSAVLDVLEAFVPDSREARNEYSAVLRLALVAEARGMVLGCDGKDPTAWTPSQHPDYRAEDVQTALGFVSQQLHCTVEHASHRLFALVEESGVCVLETSRDVIAGRLSFIGSPTGPTISIWTRDSAE